jgi:hypothetical protein
MVADWLSTPTPFFGPVPEVGNSDPPVVASSWLPSPTSPGNSANDSLLGSEWDDWMSWAATEWVPPADASNFPKLENSLAGNGHLMNSIPNLSPSALAVGAQLAATTYPTPPRCGVQDIAMSESQVFNVSVNEEPALGLLNNEEKTSSVKGAVDVHKKTKREISTPVDKTEKDARRTRSQRQQRTKHSKVEKRYRTRLNDKLAALADCVPVLRAMQRGDEKNVDNLEDSDDDKDTQANKVNKSTIMDKARDYILKLEADVKRISLENKALLSQVRACSCNTGSVEGFRDLAQNNSALTRTMVAAFMGMMADEAFHSGEQSNDSTTGRGLLAIPTWALTPVQRAIHHISLVTGHIDLDPRVFVTRLLFFGAVVYLVWPFLLSVFPTKPQTHGKLGSRTAVMATTAATGSSEPTEARLNAFLTAQQSLRIPTSWASQVLVLVAELVNLVFDKIRPRHRPSTQPMEADAARLKAWDVALDAQLLGGDQQIGGKRLLLTLLASLRLPKTSYRSMLAALHIAILQRHFRTVSFIGRWTEGLMAELSRSCWARARQLQTELGQDELPHHLRCLLDLDVDQALSSSVVRRAYELTWQSQAPQEYPSLVDSVAADPSVRSPLDAVSAWQAATTLQAAITGYITAVDDEGSHGSTRALEISLRTAPSGSTVRAYGVAAQAVLSNRDQSRLCSAALRVAATTPAARTQASLRLRTDLSLTLASAIAIATLGSPHSPKALLAVNDHTASADVEFGVLGFVALYRLVEVLFHNPELADKNRALLERLAALLRMWTGHDDDELGELAPEIKRQSARLCVQVFAWLVGKNKPEDEHYEMDSNTSTDS